MSPEYESLDGQPVDLRVERWKTALHEAAHCVVGHFYGTEPHLVVVTPAAGGECRFLRGNVDAMADAVLSFAGPAAEAISAEIGPPPPDGPEVQAAADGVTDPPVKTTGQVVAGFLEELRKETGTVPDWQHAAQWACSVEDYNQWPSRMERVKSLAAREVAIHKRLIFAIACRLYREHTLFKKDLDEMLPPRVAAVVQDMPIEVGEETTVKENPMVGTQEIVAQLEQRKAARASEYLGLVRKMADPVAKKRPGLEEIERVLADCNRTPDQFAQDVAKIEERHRLAATLAAADGLEFERGEIVSTIEKAGQELDRANQKHAQCVTPLRARLAEIANTTKEAQAARKRLEAGSLDTATIAALNELRSELLTAEQRLSTLQQQAARLKDVASDEREAKLAAEEGRNASGWQQQAERNRRAGELAEAELPEAASRVNELKLRELQLRERLLAP